jgi:hypothetical protein
MSSRTFIAEEEKSLLTSKRQRTTWLLLGASAAGKFKLESILIYQCENPLDPWNCTVSSACAPYIEQ